MEDKLNKLQSSQSPDRVKAIKIIKHQEENCRSHRLIAQALGRGMNGALMKVEVPVEVDGEPYTARRC